MFLPFRRGDMLEIITIGSDTEVWLARNDNLETGSTFGLSSPLLVERRAHDQIVVDANAFDLTSAFSEISRIIAGAIVKTPCELSSS
jgi:hypothetical protein